MKEVIDWEALARQIGAVQENTALGPYSERGGNETARKALVSILGDEFWREAVDSYVAGGRGSEVIRSVLRLLQPRPAMDRCFEIYKSDVEQKSRRYALILLADAADYSVLPWVSEFLGDRDEDINVIATWMLDRLLMGKFQDPPEEFANLLKLAETHPSQRVREQLEDLRVRERFESRI